MAKFSKTKSKRAKKRGVKPGTKRGPYRTKKGRKRTLRTISGKPISLAEMDKLMGYEKKRMTKLEIIQAALEKAGEKPIWRLQAGGKPLEAYAEHVSSVTEALPELTLCQQLEEAVTRLENRVSNSIARINSLMGKI